MKVLQDLNFNLQSWKPHRLGILVNYTKNVRELFNILDYTQNEINILKPYVFRTEDGNMCS